MQIRAQFRSRFQYHKVELEPTTAGGALINLGGGSTGISVFQSSTQTDAWTAIGYPNQFNGGTF